MTTLTVGRLSDLALVGQVIALHDSVWKRSPGILDLLRSGTACHLLLDRRGRVRGYAFVEEDRERGFFELQDIAVDPRLRGRGHGRRLLAEVLGVCGRVKLIARATDEALLGFYRAHGFYVEGVFENYYDVGVDGVRLRWDPPVQLSAAKPPRKRAGNSRPGSSPRPPRKSRGPATAR
ncbi:MAG TPA: GNAT family N-acetyltransferase [Polyangia bacterium]|nr:GNAT family N-acetyltransferase [Polyangia bacterium]